MRSMVKFFFALSVLCYNSIAGCASSSILHPKSVQESREQKKQSVSSQHSSNFNVRLRPAQPSDYHLVQDGWPELKFAFTPPSREYYLDAFKNTMQIISRQPKPLKSISLDEKDVKEVEGKEEGVGFLTVVEIVSGRHLMDYLVVLKEYQRKEYGSKALDLLKEQLRRQKASSLYLECDVTHEDAIKFYLRNGFGIEGRSVHAKFKAPKQLTSKLDVKETLSCIEIKEGEDLTVKWIPVGELATRLKSLHGFIFGRDKCPVAVVLINTKRLAMRIYISDDLVNEQEKVEILREIIQRIAPKFIFGASISKEELDVFSFVEGFDSLFAKAFPSKDTLNNPEAVVCEIFHVMEYRFKSD